MKKTITPFILLLLLTPVLAQNCPTIELTTPSNTQGRQEFIITVENPTQEPVVIGDVELHLSQAQNVSNPRNSTCLWEEEDDKCKIVTWPENTRLYPDQEIEEKIELDLCLEEKEYLTLKALVTAYCTTPSYRKTIDQTIYQSKDELECTQIQQRQNGILENITVNSHFQSYGGSGKLQIHSVNYKENITLYDPLCQENPCGEYKKFNKTIEAILESFRICAETQDSQIKFTNTTGWWKYYTYQKTPIWNNKSIQVIGKPEIVLITPSRLPVLSKLEHQLLVKTKALCGFSEITVRGETDNETIADFETSEYELTLENQEEDFAILNFFANKTGEVNFTIKATTKDRRDTEHYVLEIEKNPTDCPENETYCAGECKENPECDQDCATGEIVCKDGDLLCQILNCGEECPDEPEKVCDATGECRFPGRQGWKCNCEEVCQESYREGRNCYYSATCTNGKCEYSSTLCPQNATCTPTGCCGDYECIEPENCRNCIPDCGCDDNNPCTKDSCTAGECVNELRICGYPCPDGGCDGEGNCIPNVCCRNQDCTLNPCQKGSCVNHQCEIKNYSCIPCPQGFCYQGNCYQLLNRGEKCPCPNACQEPLTCYEGKCSTCGNQMCEVGECAICPEDCPEGFCPKGSFLGNLMIVAVIGITIIGLLAYFKVI